LGLFVRILHEDIKIIAIYGLKGQSTLSAACSVGKKTLSAYAEMCPASALLYNIRFGITSDPLGEFLGVMKHLFGKIEDGLIGQ